MRWRVLNLSGPICQEESGEHSNGVDVRSGLVG